MTNTIVNLVNSSLQMGISPSLIAAQSLNLEGHPLVEELASLLKQFDSGGKVQIVSDKNHRPANNTVQNNSLNFIDKASKQKCRGCGAAQLRQNGTCMLCEICGETSGCS